MLGQRCRRWPAYIQHRAVRLAGWACDDNAPCRPTYDTPTQCRLNVGPPYVTPVQAEPRMSTRRKILNMLVEGCLQLQKSIGHSIPRLGWCWGRGVNSGPTLNQHCVNMWNNSIFRDLFCRPKFIFCNSKLAHGRHCYTCLFLQQQNNVRFISRFYCIHFFFIRLESCWLQCLTLK